MALHPLADLFSVSDIRNHFPLSVLGPLQCTSKTFSNFLLSNTFILRRAQELHFTIQNPQDSASSKAKCVRIFKHLFPIFRQGLKELRSDLTAAKTLNFRTPTDEGQIYIRRPSWIEDIIEHGQDLLLKDVIKNQWVTETGDLPAENLSQLRVSVNNLMIMFVTAAKLGSTSCIKMILDVKKTDGWFYDTAFYTSPALSAAANNNRVECLSAIMQNDKIENFSPDPEGDLGKLLYELAKQGRLECVLAIIEGPWFSHIHKQWFGAIFSYAGKYGHLACIKALIQKDPFDGAFSTDNNIGSTCMEVANNRRHDCLVEIVKFRRINSSGYFRDAVEAIIKQGYDDCLKIMVRYSTFNEISSDSFGEFFSLACYERKANCLQTLIQSSRFAEFSVKKLAINFLNAVEKEDVSCLQVILNCGRLHEIPNEVIETAFFFGEPQSKCVELLQKHNRGYSNSPKT